MVDNELRSMVKRILLILMLAPLGCFAQEDYPDSLMTIRQPGTNFVKGIGITGSWNNDFHISEFTQLPGLENCCPKFKNGSGSGFSLGLTVDFALFDKLRLTFIPNYTSGSGEHLYDEKKTIGINGTEYSGVIEHSIKTSYSTLGLAADLDYNIWEGLFLRLGFEAGYYSVSTYEQKETLKKPENFGTFENGSRTRNKYSGDLPDGSSYRLGIIAGAGWELPLNREGSLMLIPQLNYSFGLTPLIKDYDWSVSMLELGAAVRYRFPDGIPDTSYRSSLKLDGVIVNAEGTEEELADISVSDYLECGVLKSSAIYPPAIRLLPEVITRSPVAHYALTVNQDGKLIRKYEGEGNVPEFFDWDIPGDSASIIGSRQPVSFVLDITTTDNASLTSNVVTTGFTKKSLDISSDVTWEGFNDSTKRAFNFDTLEIAETISTNMRPLLNYVFFDKKSSKIPDRYELIAKEEAAAFRIEQLKELGTMDTYYKILNIVGRRMTDYDTATIVLTGCNSDAGVESNAFALSRSRAESVKKYLVSVWGIAPERIVVKARNLPLTPSKTSEFEYYDAVRDENRRVEITAWDWRILEPVVTFDTLRSISPENIRFKCTTNGDEELESSKFTVSVGKNEILSALAKESNSSQSELNVVSKRDYIREDNNRIDYSYEGRNKKGFSCNARGYVPYKVFIRDSTYDRYSLILFDFDSYKLSEANDRISEYINTRIVRSSSGNILGTVDIVGFTDVIGSQNYNLELSTKRAESIYKDLGPESDRITYRGIGEEKPLYPDIFPEGRFYSRTVTLTVKNPVEQKSGR